MLWDGRCPSIQESEEWSDPLERSCCEAESPQHCCEVLHLDRIPLEHAFNPLDEPHCALLADAKLEAAIIDPQADPFECLASLRLVLTERGSKDGSDE